MKPEDLIPKGINCYEIITSFSGEKQTRYCPYFENRGCSYYCAYVQKSSPKLEARMKICYDSVAS